MAKKISDSRKAAYYFGAVLMGIGGLLFISVFFAGPGELDENFPIAIGGMVLIVIGGVVRSVGARGLAGSGVILDPEQAREEIGPYSRMAGGMVKDALEETGLKSGGEPRQVIMIKCRGCGQLNEEDSKFCQECGEKI